MLYNSLVYPHLTNCNSVWSSGPKTTIGKLFIAQKKIVRAITFNKSKDHSAPLMKSCNMLNIFDINRYMVSSSFINVLNEEYLFVKTGSALQKHLQYP